MTISRQRLKKIAAIRDEEIDYSDIPETDAAFWADAELRLPQAKKGDGAAAVVEAIARTAAGMIGGNLGNAKALMAQKGYHPFGY